MSDINRAMLGSWRPKPVNATTAGFPYVLLALLAATSFKIGSVGLDSHYVTIMLAALAALWMLFMHALPPTRRQAALYPVFVAGLIAITAVLVVRSSWFGFFTTVCGSYTLRLPRLRTQLAGGAFIALMGAVSQTEDSQSPLLIHLILFGAALAIDLLLVWGIMLLLREREQQVTRHRESLAELSEVNRRLEATIAENEGLHRQLLVQAREAGVVDERRRMAREIHDTLAQGLTGIVTQLQAAEQAASRTAGDPAGWRRHVAAATQLARESLTEARRSVEALRPEPLDGCRLSEALAGVAERWSSLNGIPAQVTTTGTARPVDPEAEFTLLRAAQEALANVARHAHATRVGLTISYMENEVALDVRDDGVGFDPALTEGGFGLVAMRQRITALSGTLQVESEPGGGTAVSACVPTVPGLVRT
jgi:signal transduction histidine kinase